LTDIGFIGFSWIKGNGLFSMDLDFAINVCWTSINFWEQRYSHRGCCTSALLPLFTDIVFTVQIVN